MSLDASEPKDSRPVSDLPTYIRETRSAVNAFSIGEGCATTEIEVGIGATSLSVGTDLEDAGFESIIMSGAGAAALEAILGGTQGQVKVIVFQDGNVDLVDSNDKADGEFYLNHLPALSNFAADQDDVIGLMNIGGDPSTGDNGYWTELWRSVSVK